MSDSEIIKLIRSGEHSTALEALYTKYPVFKNTFKRAGANPSHAGDIFQDALLALIEKLRDKEFILTCSINTYFFGICRNLINQYFRDKAKVVKIEFEGEEGTCEIENLDAFFEQENKYRALDKALTKIGKQCLEILTMFYHQGISMASIAKKIGFKSENSAKTQKYKCIEKARNLTLNMMSELKTELV